MRKVGVVLGVAMVVASGSSALAQSDAELSCREIGLGGLVSQWLTTGMTEDNILNFCDGYGDMQREVTALRTELNRTKSQMPPDGAILLVDHPDGCPEEGWTDMAATEPPKFAARTPVAAVQSDQESPYAYRANGGEETVTLTEAEMPKHQHLSVVGVLRDAPAEYGRSSEQGNTVYGTRIGPAYLSNTSSEGGGGAHNNMPPFIALYFCRKEAG